MTQALGVKVEASVWLPISNKVFHIVKRAGQRISTGEENSLTKGSDFRVEGQGGDLLDWV